MTNVHGYCYIETVSVISNVCDYMSLIILRRCVRNCVCVRSAVPDISGVRSIRDADLQSGPLIPLAPTRACLLNRSRVASGDMYMLLSNTVPVLAPIRT
jgi:hypothetical protein